MFCYQCEENANGGCSSNIGVCGKDNNTSISQDILVFAVKGLAYVAHELRKKGIESRKYDVFVIEGLFTTVTNVNFDQFRIQDMVKDAHGIIEEAKKKLVEAGGTLPTDKDHPANFNYGDFGKMLMNGSTDSIEKRKEQFGAVLTGLEELVIYGLKGSAAYIHHAMILGREDTSIYADINEVIWSIIEPHTAEDLLGLALKAGEINLRVMELLDAANTGAYGNPVPTPVNIGVKKGKAILISGHDMKDMEELLKQTEGKGINVYTHSEMLPAHGYPELKKYPHLVGNYGGAWHDQIKEFDAFPGSIVMTTNCIQKPKKTYQDRIFTCGLVAWPNITHIEGRDFGPAIEAALAAPGFAEDTEEKTILTGFGHNAVIGVADKVIESVKAGDMKHFYLVGGCDGHRKERSYYTDLASKISDDSVILTLGCAKFRFNKMEFGDINGIPRLLDVGQCNDSFSAIKIAVALADALDTDVNSLPLSIILAWYEQKAVSVLLTLLHLGIKNIKVGPTLPSFLEPEAVQILVDTFGLAPISENAEADLAVA